MVRTLSAIAVTAALAALAVVLGRGSPTAAKPTEPPVVDPTPVVDNKPPKPPTVALPLQQVVLFNSGVGYFQRQGEVEGNARVDLAFPLTHVNDLLKSLVLQDLGGGKIGTVGYDSQEPLDKTLRSFTLDLTTNPTFGQLLNQARGEKIEITMQPNSSGLPGTLNGVIVGMEEQPHPTAKPTEMLNMLCTEGLRSVPLAQVQRVRFLNPTLDGELRRALEVLSGTHDQLKKSVSLGFRGEGKRNVRVGYVVENPIWKTSYRLVLDAKGEPHLQGWASVENTTDEDWNNVRVVLVSGRPISFQMDLYPPLYVPRPTVEPERFAALRPPAYAGALNSANQFGMQGGTNIGFAGFVNNGQFGQFGGFGGMAALGGMAGFQGGQFGALGMQGGFNRYQTNATAPGRAGFAPQAAAPPPPATPGEPAAPQQTANQVQNGERLTYEELQKRRKEQQVLKDKAKQIGSAIAALDPREGVELAAAGGEIGDAFQYTIDELVTLPRQKSALLPIVDKGVKGTKVSIYNERVDRKFPLLGLKFKNTTGQPLSQGPITVYEEGRYAGDSRVLDLQPDEERLLSYAVDLGTEVKPMDKVAPGPKMTVRIDGNQVIAQYTLRHTRSYVIRNRSPHDRLMVIEQAVRSGWELAETSKAKERTRDQYRFEVAVPAGKTVTYDVAEEQNRSDPFAVTWGGPSAPALVPQLGLEVWTVQENSPEELQGLKIGPGEVQTANKLRVKRTYFLRNRAEEARELTLEHVVPAEWVYVGADQPVAGSKNLYRFPLLPPTKAGEKPTKLVKPNQTVNQSVTEETVRFKPDKLNPTGDVWVREDEPVDELVGLKFVKGELQTTLKRRTTRTYSLRNRLDRPRDLFLEYVPTQQWSLVGDQKPVAGTENRYRFTLRAGAGTSVSQAVTEGRLVTNQGLFAKVSEEQRQSYLGSAVVSEHVKAALKKADDLEQRLKATQQQRSERQEQLKGITDEQERLRANIGKLPAESAAYKRYLTKFDKQETEIEGLQAQIKQDTASEKKQRQALEEYLSKLTVQ